MGKSLLLFVLAVSTLFSTGILNLNRHSLESVNEYSDHYRQLDVRNAAMSGVYISFSKLYQDSSWRAGFQNLSFDSSIVNVNLASLSDWRVSVESAASCENVSDTIWVMLKMPVKLGDKAIYSTGPIDEITTYKDSSDCIDKTKYSDTDPSLQVANAPGMIPIDKAGLIKLAEEQNKVQPGHIAYSDTTYGTLWPNGSFYFDAANGIPNVTYVKGDITVLGNSKIYGIFILEKEVTFDANGTPRIYGIIYVPEKQGVKLNGGGSPKDINIIGGIVADGWIDGNGKIDVRYDRDYMSIFSKYQMSKNLYILSWRESNFY